MDATAIYSLNCSGKIKSIKPYYSDPNKMLFNIKTFGKKCSMQVLQNPGGFIVIKNGEELKTSKSKFSLRFKVRNNDKVTVYYSPIRHLIENIRHLNLYFR